jgi:hypothetical protein
MRLKKDIDEHGIDAIGMHHDLLVAALLARPGRREFQSIQRALAGQRLAAIALTQTILPCGVLLADQRRQEGIMPKIIVVKQVLIPQGQGVYPLSHEFFDRVLDKLRIAMIGEATGELPKDPGSKFDFSQQDSAAIRTDRPAVKPTHNFASAKGMKLKRLLVTLCRHKGRLLGWHKYFCPNGLMPEKTTFFN